MPEKFEHNGAEYTLPSPSGLVFESVAAAYQLYVRDPIPRYDHGILLDKGNTLVLEFGEMDAPPIHDDDTGEDTYAIRGHFAHTLEQGKAKGWSDEERAIVEKKAIVTQNASDHWLRTRAPAGKPWPSYDETQAGKVPEIAEATGTVAGALAYERENQKRPTVVGALKKLEDPQEEQEIPVEEELAAA